MRKLGLYIVVLLFFSCEKERLDIVNLNGNQITVIGHAGMGLTRVYPMNSFESISKCLSLEADGSEIDVQITKDSVLVAYHSANLESSTNLSGSIHTKTWDEIKNAKYNTLPYTQYKIIRLVDLFSNIPNLSKYVFSLDCKTYKEELTPEYVNMYTDAILRLIEQYDLIDKVFVEFQHRELIQSLKNKQPEVRILVYQAFENALDLADEFNLTGISISVANISKYDVSEAHSKGLMVSVFNANTNERNDQAIEMNVDIIQTDKLKYLIKTLDN